MKKSVSLSHFPGVTFPELPSFLFPIHPRSLGIIKIDENWKLESVQYGDTGKSIPMNKMIYFWDAPISGKQFHGNFYGSSRLQPCLSHAQSLNTIITIILPSMMHAGWAGSALITIKPKGQTLGEKMTEYDAISEGFNLGTINLLLEDPANVRVDNIDFNPSIEKVIAAASYHTKSILSSLGLPQSLFDDESISNRATAYEKIRITRSVNIDPIRETISKLISKQWYQRNFDIVYKGKKELDIYKIQCVFDDYTLEQWFDHIDKFKELHSMFPIKLEEAGKLLNIENLPSKIDPSVDPIPIDDKPSTVTDSDGDTYSIS